MSRPAVSVVMPALDARQTIGEAIASVLVQTFEDFEFVVADDGSTDGTLDVVAAISDPRVRVLDRPKGAPAGPAAARNRAVRETSADLLAWIDADDVWAPDKLARQLQALESNPSASVAYCWADYVDASGAFLFSDQRASFDGDVRRPLLLENFIISGSNTVVRRDAFEEIGGFDESLHGVEDWDLHVRLARRRRFTLVPEPLLQYRWWPGSQSGRTAMMERCWKRVAARELSGAAESELRPRATALFYEYLAGCAIRDRRGLAGWTDALRYSLTAVRNDPASAGSIARKASRLLLAV